MKPYQLDFIKFCVDNEVLVFKEFKLKSGRMSPYFFNAGAFDSGNSILKLSQFYASALIDSGIEYDVLFGPAYKGIPLVTACAMSLASDHKQIAPFSFNRKEIKDHGEGGNIVGTPLHGRVLVIDDGTAIRESVEIIQKANAKLCGVLIALDREEIGIDGTGKSAIQQIEESLNIPVVSIISMENIIEYLSLLPKTDEKLEKIKSYREQYGIKQV